MDNKDLMRPKPQVEGYRMGDVRGMGAQQKREQFLRAPTRASLDSPNNDAGQQSSQPCWPGCEKCAGAVIGQALNDPSQWVARPKLEGAAIEPVLPPGLLAMKDWLHPEDWQRVLEERALLMVKEEARQRQQAADRQPVVKVPEDLSFGELIRMLPNPNGPLERAGLAGMAQSAKAQAEKEAVRQQVERRLHGLGCEQIKAQQQDMGYRLVGESETQRFYKAEAQQPPEPVVEPMSVVGSVINQQHLQLDELGESVERLEDRLRQVLDGPTVGWQAQAPQPARAPLLEDLRSVSARMEVIHERLQSLQGRLIL